MEAIVICTVATGVVLASWGLLLLLIFVLVNYSAKKKKQQVIENVDKTPPKPDNNKLVYSAKQLESMEGFGGFSDLSNLSSQRIVSIGGTKLYRSASTLKWYVGEAEEGAILSENQVTLLREIEKLYADGAWACEDELVEKLVQHPLENNGELCDTLRGQDTKTLVWIADAVAVFGGEDRAYLAELIREYVKGLEVC